MRRLSVFASLSAAALAVAGCVAPEQPQPRAAPPVPVPVAAAPAPAPVPESADWRDWPLTPGNWSYRQEEGGSTASFGQPGQDAELVLRCDRARGRIRLSRRGMAAGPGNVPLRIRTTSTTRELSAANGGATYIAADLVPGDSLLDAIGFSRGRFLVESVAPRLVVPAWAEVLRVTEDCRG